MRASLKITPRGRVALVLLHLTAGAAILTGNDNARLAASLVGAVLVVDLTYKLLRRPHLDLVLSARRGIARAPFRELVTIYNRGERSVRDLRLRDSRLHVHSAGGLHLPFLGAASSLQGWLWLRSNRRGITERRLFQARTEYPLGFCAWRIEFEMPGRLVTEPRRVPIPPHLLDAFRDRQAQSLRPTHDDQSEFHSLREYRFGEDARLVQARRSAHLGQLVRRVLRSSPQADGSVVLDLRRPVGMPDNYGSHELEVQVGRAAAAVDSLLAMGVLLRCFAITEAGISQFECEDRGTAQGFLEFLAVAKTCAHRPLTADERALLPDSGPVLWLTGGGHVEDMAGDGNDALVLRGVVA